MSRGNNQRSWTDQVAAGGRPKVHGSLEHTFKDRVKMTAEPGGREACSAASMPTDIHVPPQIQRESGRRRATFALPSLHSEGSPHS